MTDKIAVNTAILHASAQDLQSKTQDTLSQHNAQWQQIQAAMANFPSEMYFTNAMCSENWQASIQNLYQYHEQLSKDIDQVATNFHALDNDAAVSFADLFSLELPGIF